MWCIQVLFCNLLVSLIVSTIDIIACPILETNKYITFLNGSNIFCILFHCSCWCILSILRYLFIIHKHWIDARFPNLTRLGFISILAALLLFFACLGTNVIVLKINGWPKVRVVDMPKWKMAISGSLMVGTFVLLVSLSCLFYVLILHARGKLSNEIAPVKVPAFQNERNCKIQAEASHEILNGSKVTAPTKVSQDLTHFYVS